MSEAAFAKASAASLTLARRSFSEDGRNPGSPRYALAIRLKPQSNLLQPKRD
jgi:hypothetical protein